MQISNKSKLTKKEMIIIFSIMLLFLPLFILIFFNESREIDEKMKAYPKLYRSYSFSGQLQKITKETGFKNKGSIYIDLCNGIKSSLSYDPRNYEYSPANFCDFSQKGDSIYKRANSDTIYLYRNSKVYYFILDSVINKDK